jgi:membrane protein YdbS with pleckstrin-like domain
MSEPPFPKLYEGMWGVIARWFRVPNTPPTLPVEPGENVDVFRAAPGYLRYRRIGYWIGFWIVFMVVIGGLTLLTAAMPPVGIVLAVPVLILFVAFEILDYVTVYLAYDTTWYAVGPHCVRTRSGVFINREITINFDNVQNVSTSQGPLQRRFGIANVRIDTAGLASAANQYETAKATGVSLRGLSNAEEIKELIRARCDVSQSAGLGDEDSETSAANGQGWSEAHVVLLREIRDATVALKRR